MQQLFELAINIANKAHQGQKDKTGEPYLLHVLRVMLSVETMEEKIVALLHDVVEDSQISIDELAQTGFPRQILEAVELLTKKDNIPYEEYIKGIKKNELARAVKLADLKDNMNANRLKSINERDKLRIKKYKDAYAFLIKSKAMKQNKKTILLIDDHQTDFICGLSIIAKVNDLEMKGIDSLNDGIEWFNNNQDSIGAILLDLSFTTGQYEGVQGVLDIREINRFVPIIILTGGGGANELANAVECMKNGAYHYFPKATLDAGTLFLTLKNAIKQYIKEEENDRSTQLKKEFEEKLPSYHKMLKTTEIIIRGLLDGEMMLPPDFEGRVKDFNSFYEKLIRKEKEGEKIENPFKRITDIVGFRVIFYNAEDLIKAVEILKKSKDFLQKNGNKDIVEDDISKKMGYRAVHFDLIVNPEKRKDLKEYEGVFDIPCEIQFKTIFAHSWSKVHHAISYKRSVALNKGDQDNLDKAFTAAAAALGNIEKQITKLCKNYAKTTDVASGDN